jgi:hypothetical protein
MATPCDAASLVSGAACLECGIPPGMENSVIISLLCQIANMNCTPASLIASAACLECGIPTGMQSAVIISLLCQIANGAGSGGTPIVTQSAVYPLTDGAALNVNFAHGLSAIPSYLRGALLCTANDVLSGCVAGQEYDLDGVFDSNNNQSAFGVSANATKIFLTNDGTNLSGAGASICVNGAGKNFTSFTNFSLKVYYHI